MKAPIPPEVTAFLRGGRLVVLATCAAGIPTTTPMTWVVAGGGGRVALALDRRARAYANLCVNPWAAIEIFVHGRAYVLRGRAEMVRRELPAAPFPCAVAVLEVTDVGDHSVAGVYLRPPGYSYVADKPHYARTESAILALLASVVGDERPCRSGPLQRRVRAEERDPTIAGLTEAPGLAATAR